MQLRNYYLGTQLKTC